MTDLHSPKGAERLAALESIEGPEQLEALMALGDAPAEGVEDFDGLSDSSGRMGQILGQAKLWKATAEAWGRVASTPAGLDAVLDLASERKAARQGLLKAVPTPVVSALAERLDDEARRRGALNVIRDLVADFDGRVALAKPDAPLEVPPLLVELCAAAFDTVRSVATEDPDPIVRGQATYTLVGMYPRLHDVKKVLHRIRTQDADAEVRHRAAMMLERVEAAEARVTISAAD